MNRTTLILDANAILRFILNDVEHQSIVVKDLVFKRSGEIVTKPEIISEVLYVLMKVYGVERKKAVYFLYFYLLSIECDDKFIMKALQTFEKTKLDFVDCMLCSYSREYEVFTFDKDLLKYINNKYEA